MLTEDAVVAALDQHGVKRQRMTVDSRSIVPGDVFVAISGTRTDGRDYMHAAASLGAVAILREPLGAVAHTLTIPVLDVSDLAATLGYIAAAFDGNPSAQGRV